MKSPEYFNIFGIGAASPAVALADPMQNVKNILLELNRKELLDCRFIVFPELSITGYSCGDLFFQKSLIDKASEALVLLASKLKGDGRLIVVGAPLLKNDRLYNCGIVLSDGRLLGVVPKINIPNYQEFYEKRWFSTGVEIVGDSIMIGENEVPFGTDLIFSHHKVKVGIEICEDLWVPTPPSSTLCKKGANIILNLSATDDNIGKYEYIRSLVASQSGRCRCAYAYASAGKGESSTDLVFSGINLIAYDGKIIAESKRFSHKDTFAVAPVDIEKLILDRKKYSSFFGPESEPSHIEEINLISVDSNNVKTLNPETTVTPSPFIPSNTVTRDNDCHEIVNIQSWGLAQRLKFTGCKNIVVGISGGLDSTLALLVAHYTFKTLDLNTKGITAVTMPAHATSSRTYSNAVLLMEKLGVNSLEIKINDAVSQHFKDIGHDPEILDAVYENSQARERTQILMDLANKYNGLVLGTGDMSELALGWCTYNGDHMSMYNVNAGVPKTLVKYLVEWFALHKDYMSLQKVLEDIIATPISPELLPSDSGDSIVQKTEDLVGPYELHDFFLFHVLRNGFSPAKILFLANNAFNGKYEEGIIKKWLKNFYRRFFSQQFKRSCMPDGPKIGSVCLSPRGDWRMPSDASSRLWLTELENL